MRKSLLAKKLLKNIFGLYCIVAIITTVFQLYMEYCHEADVLNNELKSVVLQSQEALEEAVLNRGVTQIQFTLDGILKNKSILAVIMLDEEIDSGKRVKVPWVTAGCSNIIKTNNEQNAFFDKKYYNRISPDKKKHDASTDLIFHDIVIQKKNAKAFLRVISTSEIVLDRVWGTLIITLINAVIKSAVLLALFYYVFAKKVTMPLVGMIEDIKSFTPAEDASTITSIIKTGKSITELDQIDRAYKKMKKAVSKRSNRMEAYSDELEEIVSERTIELSAALEKANLGIQAKSDFLSNMSHEIRTPMNGILGICSILGETNLDDHQRNFLKVLSDSSKSLLDILDDILVFSKTQSGKIELEYLPTSVINIGNDVSELLRATLQNNEIELLTDFDIIPDLLCDSTRMRQVIMNILGNAIKFTEQGTVELSIKKKEEQDDFIELEISVEDSGIGISKEQKANIFERFSQADSSTTRKYGGTGLGLAISRDLIELMGSQLHLDSELGKGSRFYFSVKFDKAEQRTDQIKKKIVFDYNTGPLDLPVLLAEDNKVNRVVAKTILEKIGCSVDCASNGKEAVAMSGTKDYSIIFMDMNMPVMDGIFATKIIRKTNEAIKIIGMSANLKSISIEDCIAAGMDEYIQKPINISVMINCINKIIK